MRCIFLGLIFSINAAAQEALPDKLTTQLEAIAEAMESEEVDEQYVLKAAELLRNPLYLNDASASDLEQSGLVTPQQAAEWVRYRARMGKLVSLYELQAVPLWDLATIRRAWPFLSLGSSSGSKLKERWQQSTHTVSLRAAQVLERSRGYGDTSGKGYKGSPQYLQLRYRAQYSNHFYLGITAEKDAGEPLFRAPFKGFDFYSFHFFARKIGKLEALAIGDFQVNMGQGLVHWQAAAFGRGGELTQFKRQAPVLEPYRASGESGFTRGIGATIRLAQKWELSAYYARNAISSNSDTGTFSTLRHSGLHRTAHEISQRGAISVQSAGTVLRWRTTHLYIGWNVAASLFSKAFQKRDAPYNFFAPRGRQFFNSSIDYAFTYKNMHHFGEAAFDQQGRVGFLHGFLLSLHQDLDLGLVFRSIAKDYTSMAGDAFTENSLPVNETGLYAGISFRPHHRLQLQAFADVCAHPWLRYRADAPGRGKAGQVQLTFTPNRHSGFYLLYRFKTDEGNGVKQATYHVAPISRQTFRVHFQTQLGPSVSVKSRCELSWHISGQEKEEGFLLYIEGVVKRSPFHLTGRIQYFETGGYDSRIYTYEPDIFGGGIPASAGTGFRYFLACQVQVKKKWTIAIRAAQTFYSRLKTTGSGLDLIGGNTKTDVKTHLIYTF